MLRLLGASSSTVRWEHQAVPPTVQDEADGTVLLFCLDVTPVISIPCQLKPERPCNVANVTPTLEVNHPPQWL